MTIDMDAAAVSAGTAIVGDYTITPDTGNELIDLLIKVCVPLITGIVIPSIRDAVQKRKERKLKTANHGNS